MRTVVKMKVPNDLQGASIMAATQSLKLSDSKRTYPESVTHARTLQAQTVSRAGTLTRKTGGESVDTKTDKVDLNRNGIL